jgi:hypothetical protein
LVPPVDLWVELFSTVSALMSMFGLFERLDYLG